MPKRYIPNDNWSRKAAELGFRARSVFKLQELNEKFKLIRPGMTVVDLGAAPGSWLQYASGKMKVESGKLTSKVIGVDLQEIEPIEHVETHVLDITDHKALQTILPKQADLILSDLAPKTSGIQDVDQWKSIELSQAVLDVARVHLKPGGWCVMKVLRGADFDEFLRECKAEWKTVKTCIPKACRDRSKEIYILVRS